jgi:hypothetical protein
MEPTFLHIHRDDWKGECPRCLQQSVPEALSFEAIMGPLEEQPYPELFQQYIKQQAEEQMKLQEQMVREELLRTYLISTGGPGIVKAILGQLGSETGERLFAEIQEEAKKYLVEEDGSGNTDTHGDSSIRRDNPDYVRRSNGE